MRRYLKLLTLCFVMLALPFKGMAAANIEFCGPGHEQVAPSAGHHDHHHDGDSAPHHHDGESADKKQTDSHDKMNLSGIAKCLACAACGAHAVAGTPSIVTPDFISTSPISIPFLSSMHAGIFAYGLERPPKTLLA